MSKIHIKYMSDAALATLKANKDEVTNKLIANPTSSEWLSNFVGADLYVTKKYEIEDFVLKIPSDEKARETDIYTTLCVDRRTLLVLDDV